MDLKYQKIVELKSGRKVTLRIPKISDAKSFSIYINKLVQEDTFISSETQTVLEEEKYIKSLLNKIKNRKEIHIIAIIGTKKIGAIDIFSQGVRKEHIGELQVNISKDYRGDGLGKILVEEALNLAKEDLKLRMLTLTVFDNNEIGRNLYIKSGFVDFAVLPKAIRFKDNFIDEIYMYKVL